MSKPAVEIKALSKAYMIGHEREAALGTMTFRDTLSNLARKPLELITGHQLKKEKFWALKDVNIEIEKGDVVGIIGRNGSGKSTLLKVLSRIVEPTKGEVIMRGRVASLLEVGTGFHPELTGRENVYFNGAILGMSRKEVKSKFDEIVAFSEVEKFLDTPVKFYSSGMYVRLAFAVAAHLDPDILIVDEVLAVGDAAFQKKCLRKMQQIASEGRTVVFVSHSMSAVQSLCKNAVFMESGQVRASGTVAAMFKLYNESLEEVSAPQLQADDAVQILGTSFRPKTGLQSNLPITFSVNYKIIKPVDELYINLHVDAEDGTNVLHSRLEEEETRNCNNKGSHTVEIKFQNSYLVSGGYTAFFRLYATSKVEEYIVDSSKMSFRIDGQDSLGRFVPPASWSVKSHPSKKS